MLKGCDVSSHNGEINWNVVKPQIDFAIIRLGYGDNIESQDDRYFQKNVKGCIDNNITFAVYIYSYAKNLSGSESIQSEIEHTKRQLSKISQKPFCVYIDMEDDSTIYLQKLMLTNFALEFCKQITQAGYKAGVYANENWFKNYLNPSTIASYGYSIWCAKYSSYKPVISSNYDIWQYSADGHVNGIYTKVDMNYMYRDIRDIKPYSPIKIDDKVNVYYRVKTQKHGWLDEVKNLEDYAGYQNSPITDIAIKVDKGRIWYQVHVKGGNWLSRVDGYDLNDYIHGYAGNGKPIDAIRAYYYTPNDIINISGYKRAKYRINNYSWQYDTEKEKNGDDFAGVYGVNATKFQIIIE